MAETRRKFDRDLKEGAVRLVREAGCGCSRRGTSAKRSQRCPLGGGRGVALRRRPGGPAGRSRRGAHGLGPSAIRTWAGPAPRWPAGYTRCCGLIPRGVPGEITAGQAGQILASITPAGAVAAARSPADMDGNLGL